MQKEEKGAFYHQLQTVYDQTPRQYVTLVIEDFNAKIGSNNNDIKTVMGRHGLNRINENGEIFADFCTSNEMVIGRTIFPYKPCHKATWQSPSATTENEIDHIAKV